MLFKRKNSQYWYCKFAFRGKTVKHSTCTSDRAEAEEYEIKLRHDLWQQQRLGSPADYTWESVALRWLDEKSQKRSIAKDKTILRWLTPHLQGRLLRSITADELINLRNKKAAQTSRANANRVMALVRSIMRYALEAGMISAIPKVRMFDTEQYEPVWITREQFDKFVTFLRPVQAEIARFAVSTGLRRTNITHLTWDKVDLDREVLWVEGAHSKNKRPIGLPLNDTALAVLRRRRGQHPKWVFAYRGKPLIQTSTKAWRAAVIKAGIPAGFRFHDLRHTWASWHVQSGTSLRELQELGGWASYQMVLRYAHLNPTHLSTAAKNIDKLGSLSVSPRLVKTAKGS